LYRVPPSYTRDLRLRRAIALAVITCSLGAAFLGQLLSNDYLGRQGGVFAIVAYFVLIIGCEFASDRLWTRGLYGLALGGLLLGLICIAILLGYLFNFAPSVPWRWSEWNNLSVPALVLLIAPIHIRRLWARAERRAETDSLNENEED
jgi:MFS family permease